MHVPAIGKRQDCTRDAEYGGIPEYEGEVSYRQAEAGDVCAEGVRKRNQVCLREYRAGAESGCQAFKGGAAG